MPASSLPVQEYLIYKAQILRDFFSSYEAASLQAACQSLALPVDTSAAPLCWQDLAYTCTRVFLGPKAPPAPLFASVYLEAEPVIMGKSTLQMRDLLRELHLAVPHEGTVPDDYLPYELDAWCVLVRLAAVSQEPPELQEGLVAARTWLEGHMRAWVPCMVEQARCAAQGNILLLFMLTYLQSWVDALDCQTDPL